MEIQIIFIFTFLLLCCTSKISVRENLMVEIKILKTDVVFL